MSSHRNWLRYGPTRSPDVSPRNTVAGVHFVPVGGERFGESVYVGDGGCNERVCVINAERHVAGQCKPVGQRTHARETSTLSPSIRRYPDCSVLTGHHLDHNLSDLDPNLFSG